MLFLTLILLLVSPIQSSPMGSKDIGDVVILERTSCFGNCPSYVVQIQADGSVSYDGRSSVKTKGKKMFHIDRQKFVDLLKQAESFHFFDLDSKYVCVKNKAGQWVTVTDFPTTFITVRTGDRSKRIELYVGGPKELWRFAKEIDDVTGMNEIAGQGPGPDASTTLPCTPGNVGTN
jgi:hypothetical protein